MREEPSFGDLLRDLSREAGDLLRKEVALAKTEVSEKASRATSHAGHLATGGLVALLGAIVLMVAVVTGVAALLDTVMSTELAAFLAPLLVGGVLAFVGYGMVRKALDGLRGEGIVPEKTRESLREATAWLKTRVS
jgi:hypothetical protein